jgi:hypothetical protein
MITIFCDFRRINWRFSQKPMLWSIVFIIKLCFEPKTPSFRRFFWRKYLENRNIGPCQQEFEAGKRSVRPLLRPVEVRQVSRPLLGFDKPGVRDGKAEAELLPRKSDGRRPGADLMNLRFGRNVQGQKFVR